MKNAIVTGMWLFALGGSLLQAQFSQTNSFTALNKTVPDGNIAGLSDVRVISSPIAELSRVVMKLRIQGEFNGDLYGYLRQITPDRTNFCVILNRPGKTAANSAGYDDSGFDVTLDDAAASGDIHSYQAVVTPAAGLPLTGLWQPDGRRVDPISVLDTTPRTTTLGSFSGASASGEWTLFLADLESGGTNFLVSWALELEGVALPEVTWPAPADIVYGTGLGAAQLNASSSVPGTFTYNPPAGTVFNAGPGQVLSVTFTPTDPTHEIVSTNVTINVLKKSLTITANDQTKVYGTSLPSLTATYNGFVNGDTAASLDTPISIGTTATTASSVGSYPITVSGASDANYQITFVNGTLSITPATLTITAISQSKRYGAPVPGFLLGYNGFVNGETSANLDTPPVGSTTATAASSVGSYPITVSGATDANYTINFVAGTLTVTPAPLTISADNQSKAYGAPVPTLTVSYAGFVNGDIVANLDTPAVASTTATAASPVGSYPITIGGASDANYSITFVPGSLTVTPATLTITAADANKVYGAPLPAFSANYIGFVNGETPAALDTPVTFTTSATTSSDVGSYAIEPGGATDANYTIAFVNGTLSITRASTLGTIASSSNPALPGQLVTFTFTASPVAPSTATPAGNVSFKIDATSTSVPLVNGVATLSSSSLAVGTHVVEVEYPGNANRIGVTNRLSPDQLINTLPLAAADEVPRYLPYGVKVRIATLLGNDIDADGDTLAFVSAAATTANGGTITRQGDWLCYAAPEGFTSNDSFTYTITDGRGQQVIGTVNIQVQSDPLPSPNLTLTHLGDGVYRIRFSGVPGVHYRIQYSDSVSPPAWQSLGSATADDVGMFELIDTVPNGVPQRFYRSVYP